MLVKPDAPLLPSKITVSCANGKLASNPEPPELVAQGDAVVTPQLPPEVPIQYLFVPAGNVIPLLPLQSPKRVPLTGAAAPAMVMSRKSASVPEKAAQVSVRVVPMVSERTNVRIVALVPADSVRVPLMVWLAEKEIDPTPELVCPATVKLLNVFEPFIGPIALIEVEVKEKL